ncbi:glycosyltransferase family 4 protein [Methanococcoides alaskense]|uniref:Glycosyltransferase involved in cell wall biosynthesis n=1 Tax=Methanococcoides alaskense TaxID=325778 RepID=A0AA90ZD29_9EURY|nr:glycosyltransferase family 4 protein [Methanococcoides alaskense]MDA0524405.1 glycosyltransferase family 4 protein [Methanococcoides alaskense]MDR6223222.1 glycosyltransferase involved in cell wall biosynthesis [Methanococcoides alaskense]
MELVYFYSTHEDAPARVGKSILKELINHMDDLPFEDILLFTDDEENIDHLIYGYKFKSITFSELIRSRNKYVVHIPISPNIFPNLKFLINLLSILKKFPLILHYHGDVRNEFYMRLKYEKHLDIMCIPSVIFIPFLLRYATRIVTHSFIVQNILIDNYNIKKNVVIPNGLDDYWYQPLEQIESYRLKNLIDKSKTCIFYHGRLPPEKGVDMLIKAVGKYVKFNSQTMLYIAGDAPYKKYLLELCTKLNITENVVFLGNVDRETIKFFLQNVDVAIYPSRFDAFNLAVMEAFACANCPVFFSSKAGIYNFVLQDGYQLNHFEPTTEKITDILSLVSSGYNENDIHIQKEFANKYRWGKIINCYMNLYDEVLTNANKLDKI